MILLVWAVSVLVCEIDWLSFVRSFVRTFALPSSRQLTLTLLHTTITNDQPAPPTLLHHVSWHSFTPWLMMNQLLPCVGRIISLMSFYCFVSFALTLGTLTSILYDQIKYMNFNCKSNWKLFCLLENHFRKYLTLVLLDVVGVLDLSPLSSQALETHTNTSRQSSINFSLSQRAFAWVRTYVVAKSVNFFFVQSMECPSWCFIL